jgi:hypothetical protein
VGAVEDPPVHPQTPPAGQEAEGHLDPLAPASGMAPPDPLWLALP